MTKKTEINAKKYETKLNYLFEDALLINKNSKDFKRSQNLMQLRLHLIALSNMQVDTFEEALPVANKLKGKIINYIKKTIRKATRFLLNPYALKINIYQKEVSRTLGTITKILEDME